MTKVVFFDVGGTLLHAHPSVGGVYSKVAARHGVDAPAEILDRRFADAWGRLKSVGKTVEKTWWREVINDVFSAYRVPDGDHFFEDLYESFRDPAAWALFPDVRHTLEELKNRGVRLAVASNWDERLPALLDGIGLTSHFERRFISFAVGYSKPDIRFFQAALRGMNVDPRDAVHVGDDPVEDVEGAASADIRAFLIDRHQRRPGPGSILRLTDILERL